jgi:type IV pilus assembly protein PilV
MGRIDRLSVRATVSIPLNKTTDTPAERVSRSIRCSNAPGYALLEVLVSLVILAVGMLGIAGLLVTTVKSNSSAYLKQQAVQSAYDIVDNMRANGQQAIAGAYNACNLQTGCAGGVTAPPTSEPSPQCDTSACSAAQMANWDLWRWASADLGRLPSGTGSVTTAAAAGGTLVTVTVQWNDSPAASKLGNASTSPASGLAQYTIQTLL